MAEVRVRPKHQITLPVGIVRAAGLEPNDRLNVTFVNGSIILTPCNDAQDKDDLLSYAGIFRGAWGDSAQEVEASIRGLNSEWQS